MTNRVVAMENKLSQTEQYLAEANQHVEQLERELRRALIGLRTVRPCVEVYRDKYDYTVGTAMLSDFNALVSRLGYNMIVHPHPAGRQPQAVGHEHGRGRHPCRCPAALCEARHGGAWV